MKTQAGTTPTVVGLADDHVADANASSETFEPVGGRWFAWHPVKSYMSPRYAWLRPIYRRCVNKSGLKSCDYTDSPEDFPS
jgi:hypothetical protein